MDRGMDSERVNPLLGSCWGCLNDDLDKEEENMGLINKRKEERVDTSSWLLVYFSCCRISFLFCFLATPTCQTDKFIHSSTFHMK